MLFWFDMWWEKEKYVLGGLELGSIMSKSNSSRFTRCATDTAEEYVSFAELFADRYLWAEFM